MSHSEEKNNPNEINAHNYLLNNKYSFGDSSKSSSSGTGFNSSSSSSTWSSSPIFSGKTETDFLAPLLRQIELVSAEVGNLKGIIKHDVDKGRAEILEIKGKLDSEIKDTRGSILSSLALFVGFFSFISVNVGIYSKAESVFDALLVLITCFICILIFVVVSIFAIHNERNFSNSFISIALWSIILLSCFISILCLGFIDKHSERVMYRLDHKVEWTGNAPNVDDMKFDLLQEKASTDIGKK
ncbi:hypothetical protein [Aeromonas veronii]|uniref:hypothetical protein n=1 Tax=Aeromonas veronii TaxID=654 RepID=UPI002B4A1549|nr:hypothetical protein [Aeromonas veronii]